MNVATNAAADRRRGLALTRRFANAVATFDDGTQVNGLLTRETVSALLGGLTVGTRETDFACVTAELPAGVIGGSRVAVAMGDALTTPTRYRVTTGGRTDDHEEGTTVLQLELA